MKLCYKCVTGVMKDLTSMLQVCDLEKKMHEVGGVHHATTYNNLVM
jgi:hypothetical protein